MSGILWSWNGGVSMVETKAVKGSSFTAKKMTRIAILGAISVLLSVTPLGYIPINPVIQVTIMHIPVIIAAIVEGMTGGVIVGLIFGISSLIHGLSTPLAPVFINPMVSIFPRIMIGVVSAYTYKKTKNVPLTAAIGTFVNTAGVLSMIYVFAPVAFASVKNVAVSALGKILLTVAVTNGIPEMIAAVIIVTAVMKALAKKIK